LIPSLPVIASPYLSPAAELQLNEGLTRLYGLDYTRSRAAFRKLIELEPDNPYGYLFEAGGIWWESSQQYGLFADTPTLQGLFEQDIEAAQRKANIYIESNDPAMKANGYFVSGMALGTLGQWRLMKHHYIDAFLAGKKAIKHLKKCARLDPEFYDVFLGLGVFDYQASRLSGVAKLGMFFGFRGDEKKGLDNIQLAIDKAKYSSAQAAELLSQVYIIDFHDFARALPVIMRLRSSFPDSPYFIFLEALLRHRLGDWDASLALGQLLFKRIESNPRAFRPKWLTLVCGLSGSHCLESEDVELSLSWFDHALESDHHEKSASFLALAHLLRGQLLDAVDRHPEALQEYKKVAGLPSLDFVRERATECQTTLCNRLEILARLRQMSKEEPLTSPIGNEIVTPKR
jgi:tetratricopeptide (TPR) repeat protein